MLAYIADKGRRLSNNEWDCNFHRLDCLKCGKTEIVAGLGVRTQVVGSGVVIFLDSHVGSEQPSNNELFWIVT
jgi:hypothetical protein